MSEQVANGPERLTASEDDKRLIKFDEESTKYPPATKNVSMAVKWGRTSIGYFSQLLQCC